MAQHQRIDTNPFDRLRESLVIEMQQWTGVLWKGTQPTGPDAWDGYATIIAAESCVASLQSSSLEKVTVPERPDLYSNENSEVGQ